MRIQLNDENTSKVPPYFLGGRSRLASCTSVKFVNANQLIACSLMGQCMHLIRFDIESGDHQIESTIQTVHKDRPVVTDLLDVDESGRVATSNFDTCSLTLYQLDQNQLSFWKDVPIQDAGAGFCHGVKFVPGGQLLSATCTSGSRCVYFIDIKSGAVIHKFNDGDWRPRDVCFSGANKMIVISGMGAPSRESKTPYQSKISLIALDLNKQQNDVVDVAFIDACNADCCQWVGDRVYLTNQMSDRVVVYRVTDDRLVFDRNIEGYDFPHGLDVGHDLLAVTNYGDNTIDMKRLLEI